MSGTSGMSLSDDVPVPVRAFVDTTNAGDSEAFVALFTPDAFLSDRGREFRGRDGAAAWNESDNIGMRAHFELVGVKPGDTDQEVVATVVATSDRFNGTGDIRLTLRGDEIARMVIEP